MFIVNFKKHFSQLISNKISNKSKNTVDEASPRLLALEGLRGVAAVIVVIFHGLSMFYPAMLYGVVAGVSEPNSRFEDNVYGNPLSVFISGAFAVAVFFVLSGFVLTVRFFGTGNSSGVTRIASKRYLRLMFPALASILITFLIVAFGLSWLKNDAAAITGSVWMRDLWPQSASLLDALSQGVWGVFFSSGVDTSYNPVLWTMKFELVGSLIVFAVVILFGKAKHRWVIYILAICATFKTWYLAFVIGMILADLYANKKFPFVDVTKKYGWLVILLIAGLFLGGYPYTIPEGSVYAAVQIAGLGVSENQSFFLSIAAGMLIIAVISLKFVSSFFGSRLISILGKYSFSIYLTHMAVLFTVGAGVFLLAHQQLGFHLAGMMAITTSLLVVVPVSYLFERYIDSPSIRVSGDFADWLFGDLKKKK